MNYKNIALIGFLGLSVSAFSQETKVYTNNEKNFKKALLLYKQKKYNASQHFFEKESLKNNPLTHQASSFYTASAGIRSQQPGAKALMEQFLVDYPQSVFIDKARFDMGEFYFDDGEFALAKKWFNQVDEKGLNASEKEDFYFQKAYTAFMLEDFNAAKTDFLKVQHTKQYASKVVYYLGYIAYAENDYAQAQTYFNKVKDPNYLQKIAYYQADMSFKQGNFAQALEQGLARLQSAKDEKEISELNKIVGESFFNQKKYKEALPYLQAYKGRKGKFTNTDFYYLGYSHYKQNDYQNAINYFNRIIDGHDAVAQNAYYHLAECYLKTQQKSQAFNAFRNASQMNFDSHIKKDAMLNYARLSYEIGNPYQSVSSVIEQFIQWYPNDNASAEMRQLLVSAYIQQGDYKSALHFLENEMKKGNFDQNLYQNVAFHYGISLFDNKKFQEAISILKKAENGNFNLKAKAFFWQGEAYYQIGNTQQAENFYTKFLNLSPKNMPEIALAHYGLGYLYFNEKKFDQALVSFDNFLSLNQLDKNKIAEIRLRKADAFFALAKYQQAIDGYSWVLKNETSELDYPFFQRAISYGFVEKLGKKMEELESFIKKFPKSNLREDALFELGNSYSGQGNTQKALELYQKIRKENKGIFVARALLREGLIYYNEGDNQKSLSLFKEVTENFPNTTEALQAVNSAKLVYTDLGKIDQYAKWVKDLGYEISDSEVDNSAFEYAEKQFIQQKNKDAVIAFEKYLKDFPQGLNAQKSRFSLAQLYFEQGNKAKAKILYEKILEIQSEFSEMAMVRLSQIYLEEKNFKKAENLLKEVENISGVPQNISYAQSNLMKILFEKQQFEKTISYAQKVLTNANIDARIKNDAHLLMGRSYVAINDLTNAEKMYAEVRKTATGNTMAEALYYDAFFKNKAGQFKKSNEIIQQLAKNFGGYKEFSAKGLILMAKNFYSLKDAYQATYILNSVVENFQDYPEIVKEAKEMVTKIKTNEAKANESVEL